MLRADENNALFFNAARKRCVLAQKAVAGMNSLGASLFAGRDDFFHHQIRLARRRRADQHRLIGQLHVARVPIRI